MDLGFFVSKKGVLCVSCGWAKHWTMSQDLLQVGVCDVRVSLSRHEWSRRFFSPWGVVVCFWFSLLLHLCLIYFFGHSSKGRLWVSCTVSLSPFSKRRPKIVLLKTIILYGFLFCAQTVPSPVFFLFFWVSGKEKVLLSLFITRGWVSFT